MNSPQTNRGFEALLNYLKHNRGCDLTGYKRSILLRRLEHRLQSINVSSYEEYLQYLQNHADEWMALLDTVLINVTSFFRDRDVWNYLAGEIVPQLVASKQPDEPIRVWSAGCASGHEVYSLLILFAEALGIESCLQRVQFYATDVDADAIQQARLATYSSNEVTGISPNLLEKYFEPVEQGYVFHGKLRSKIVFAHHNLAKDAPMSKIDLLACRNVLMYFNPEIQASILVRFHFALKDNGFLFLGSAETVVTNRQIFTPVNLKHRVFTKGLNLELEERLLITPKSNQKQALDTITTQTYIWQTAYATSPFAQLAVDIKGCLVVANEQANALFGLTPDALNRPFRELEPGKLVTSHASMRTFYRDRRSATLKNIEWITTNSTKYLDIFSAPIFSHNKYFLGVNLTFIDASDRQRQAAELERANLNLARVSETLELTKDTLESTQKELKTLDQKMQLFERNQHTKI